MLLSSVGKNTVNDTFCLVFREHALGKEIKIDEVSRKDFKQLLKWGIDQL